MAQYYSKNSGICAVCKGDPLAAGGNGGYEDIGNCYCDSFEIQ